MSLKDISLLVFINVLHNVFKEVETLCYIVYFGRLFSIGMFHERDFSGLIYQQYCNSFFRFITCPVLKAKGSEWVIYIFKSSGY